jgi:hypothetical protein
MLSELEASGLIKSTFPNSRIEKPIFYRGLFVFQVFGDDPLEGDQDPFYSVDQKTGELRDFSILTDGDPKEIEAEFLKVQKSKRQ